MRRSVQDLFVAGGPLRAVFALEIVGVRLEEDAEDVAVALGDVVRHGQQRVVAGLQQLVLRAQPVGRVLELVLHGGVEEEREARVVEQRHAQSREQVHHGAYRALFAASAAPQSDEIFLAGHLRGFRSWFRASGP